MILQVKADEYENSIISFAVGMFSLLTLEINHQVLSNL